MSNVEVTNKCIVLEVSKYSLDGTEKFGELEYVFPADKRRASIWTEKWEKEFIAGLKRLQFDANLDYFVVVGPILPVARAINVLARNYRMFRALAFNSTQQKYEIVIMGGDSNE